MKKLLWIMPLFLCACIEEKETTELGNPKEAAYSKSFENKYGSIAADQDWGFNDIQSRSIIKEPHEWRDLVAEVPAKATQAEIDNVCAWFKNHPDAVSENLNWSDFWIVPIYHSNYASRMNQVVIGEEVNDINGGVDWLRLVRNGNTQQFGYHNSESNERFVNKHYTIQEIDGSYYLGFQFYGEKWDNGPKIFGDNDGTCDDWIFRLVPAVYKGARRIIAEDLGSIGDFDFNDVVFDAAQVDGQYVITLHAAGGTLPLYVGGKEVHELFGVPTGDMVNTGTKKNRAVVVFRAPDTKIVVKAYKSETAAGSYVLKAECGKAPQMICVPPTYEWTLEGQSIEKKYPKFADWVGNKDVDWLN